MLFVLLYATVRKYSSKMSKPVEIGDMIGSINSLNSSTIMHEHNQKKRKKSQIVKATTNETNKMIVI